MNLKQILTFCQLHRIITSVHETHAHTHPHTHTHTQLYITTKQKNEGNTISPPKLTCHKRVNKTKNLHNLTLLVSWLHQDNGMIVAQRKRLENPCKERKNKNKKKLLKIRSNLKKEETESWRYPRSCGDDPVRSQVQTQPCLLEDVLEHRYHLQGQHVLWWRKLVS